MPARLENVSSTADRRAAGEMPQVRVTMRRAGGPCRTTGVLSHAVTMVAIASDAAICMHANATAGTPGRRTGARRWITGSARPARADGSLGGAKSCERGLSARGIRLHDVHDVLHHLGIDGDIVGDGVVPNHARDLSIWGFAAAV